MTLLGPSCHLQKGKFLARRSRIWTLRFHRPGFGLAEYAVATDEELCLVPDDMEWDIAYVLSISCVFTFDETMDSETEMENMVTISTSTSLPRAALTAWQANENPQ